MGLDPQPLVAAMESYRQITTGLDRPPGRVTLMRGLPLADAGRSRELLNQYAELDVERLVCAIRYDTTVQFTEQLESLSRIANDA